jgi:cellulose synthase/poly-beta-1,6-N-acetylglucosamine synthase-like glycosyltransferase
VSVVVPALRGDDNFRACLASLAALDPPPADLVVAVDGGDPAAVALARGCGARVVVLDERAGPARARNAAARVAEGDVLFFVDADVTLPPDAIAQVVAALADHPDHAAIVGSYDDDPAAPNFLSQYKNLAHRFVHQTARDEACAFWSACGVIRRDAFARIGGYDERYRRSSIEDIELGSRLIEGGARIRLVKSLTVKHLKRWTLAGLVRSEIFDRALPWTRLILASGRMPDDLNLQWSGRVAVAAACGLGTAVVASIWVPWARPVAVALVALEIAIDAPLARFLHGRRGPVFAVRALAWQWVHYVCAAAGFGMGLAMHLVIGGRLAPAPAPAAARPDSVAGDPGCQ